MYWKLYNIGLTPHCLYRYSLTLCCEMKNAFNNNRSLLKSGYGAFCLIANIINVRAKDKVWIKPDTKSFFARTAEYFLVFSSYVYLVICAAYGVTLIWISFHLIIYSYCSSYFKAYPLHIGRKLNVRKMFRRRPIPWTPNRSFVTVIIWWKQSRIDDNKFFVCPVFPSFICDFLFLFISGLPPCRNHSFLLKFLFPVAII